jgi:hypothetical protein
MGMSLKINDNSDAIKQEFMENIERGAIAIGDAATGYAKEGCPVDTSRLMNSIDHREEIGYRVTKVYIGTNVKYAKYVEFNTKVHHKVGGPHFLKNAAANHANEYKNIMETSLRT